MLKINYTNNIFRAQLRITKLSLKHTEISLITSFERISENIIINNLKVQKITSGKHGKQEMVLLDDTNLEVNKCF